MNSLRAALLGAVLVFPAIACAGSPSEILNVSYDPTRELYRDFNQAFANPDLGDIDLTLETQNAINPATGTCFQVLNVPNGVGTTNQVCDPTKGYTFTQRTLDSFGLVRSKHGHRRIELALKFYF